MGAIRRTRVGLIAGLVSVSALAGAAAVAAASPALWMPNQRMPNSITVASDWEHCCQAPQHATATPDTYMTSTPDMFMSATPDIFMTG